MGLAGGPGEVPQNQREPDGCDMVRGGRGEVEDTEKTRTSGVLMERKPFFSNTECTLFSAFERFPLLCDVGKSSRIQKSSQIKGKEVEHFGICQEKGQENQD